MRDSIALTPVSLLQLEITFLRAETLTILLDRAANAAVANFEPFFHFFVAFIDGKGLFNVKRCSESVEPHDCGMKITPYNLQILLQKQLVHHAEIIVGLRHTIHNHGNFLAMLSGEDVV